MRILKKNPFVPGVVSICTVQSQDTKITLKAYGVKMIHLSDKYDSKMVDHYLN